MTKEETFTRAAFKARAIAGRLYLAMEAPTVADEHFQVEQAWKAYFELGDLLRDTQIEAPQPGDQQREA